MSAQRTRKDGRRPAEADAELLDGERARSAIASVAQAMDTQFPNDWSTMATVAGGQMYRTTLVRAAETAWRLDAGKATDADLAAIEALPRDAIELLGYASPEDYLRSVAVLCVEWHRGVPVGQAPN